jgi:hypothetical protein
VAGGWKKYFDDELEKAFEEWIEKLTLNGSETRTNIKY